MMSLDHFAPFSGFGDISLVSFMKNMPLELDIQSRLSGALQQQAHTSR